MKNRNEMSATILANVEVFDYLKEKVGERKTRTEAYCDLLDKALAGFVSPFLRKQDYELQSCQCHVTISDLAAEWHWHRATGIARPVGKNPVDKECHYHHVLADRPLFER